MNVKTVNLEFLDDEETLPGPKPLPIGGYNGMRFAFYGMITEVHPEDNTVHVRMDTGRILSGVRVLSLEWVTIDDEKGFLSGQRRLPPVNTFVICLMPTGEPNSAVVLCSAFGFQVAEHAAFKEDSEDAAHIRKLVTNAGWIHTEDNRTGTIIIQNKEEEPEIKFEINLEDEENFTGTVTIYDNVFSIDKKNGLKLQAGDNVCLEIDRKSEGKEKAYIQVNDNIAEIDTEIGITAETDKDIFIKCSKTGLLEIGNTIATLGSLIVEYIDLTTELNDIVTNLDTVGSPANHKTGPVATPKLIALKAKIEALKAKWEKVFK